MLLAGYVTIEWVGSGNNMHDGPSLCYTRVESNTTKLRAKLTLSTTIVSDFWYPRVISICRLECVGGSATVTWFWINREVGQSISSSSGLPACKLKIRTPQSSQLLRAWPCPSPPYPKPTSPWVQSYCLTFELPGTWIRPFFLRKNVSSWSDLVATTIRTVRISHVIGTAARANTRHTGIRQDELLYKIAERVKSMSTPYPPALSPIRIPEG